MYINFKSKYKKFFWLLLGFVLSCIYVHHVNAAPSFSTYDFNDYSFSYGGLTLNKDSFFQMVNEQLSLHNKSLDDYQYITFSIPTNPTTASSQVNNYFKIFLHNVLPVSCTNSQRFSDWLCDYDSADLPIEYFYIRYNFATKKYNSGVYSFNSRQYYVPWLYSGDSSSATMNVYTNYDFTPIFNKSSYNLYTKFYHDSQMLSTLPDYLQGYKEIVLQPGERYYMFSSSTISSGSVYIPLSDFNDYGSRISYFDKDIDTQPYTSYIQDFSTTPDGLYAKQNFDLSTYTGSDFIMYSKYIYLEGQDNFSSSVWVPEAMYSSLVEVTPNNTGGNDFDFSYVDTNGELQAQIISSSDLSQGSPLVSDLFTNFTTKDYGLSSIITAPIPLLQTLNNASCSTIELPLGMFGGQHDNRLILPCMAPIYSSMFGQFFTLYQSITTGFIAYYVGLAYFNKIKQLKDPDNDDIEVVDL